MSAVSDQLWLLDLLFCPELKAHESHEMLLADDSQVEGMLEALAAIKDPARPSGHQE